MINRKGAKNRRERKRDKVVGGKGVTKWSSVRQSVLGDQFFRKDQHDGPVITIDPEQYVHAQSPTTEARRDDQGGGK